MGIGDIIINGALDFKMRSSYRSLDDLLILRPFPQVASGGKDLLSMRKDYREEMISKAGIAIFIFGNKLEDGIIIDSAGMEDEFEICIKKNVIPIPVGATGSISKKLWKKVSENLNKYYPNDRNLFNAIEEIGNESASPEELTQNILKTIEILQKI